MKIIHTADIHLDSPLVGVANPVQRRLELLQALQNLVNYANNNGVDAIIVAGDLFDDKFATQATVNSVADVVKGCKAQWYVLRGNHGDGTPYAKLGAICPQIHFFGDDWTTYALGNVRICGRELGNDDRLYWQKLHLDGNNYNLLVLHGDVEDDSYGVIDGKIIAHSHVNYVALGHRHAYATYKMGNATVCYCGVLEARGFDELAPTGFVVVDTDTGKHAFVPQSIRRVQTVTVDVSTVISDIGLQNLLADVVGQVSTRNYLNVNFVGTLNANVHLLPTANDFLQGKFFALRLKDNTSVAYNLAELSKELSLRGEFVKLALQIEDEEQRNKVIKLGLSALNGEALV